MSFQEVRQYASALRSAGVAGVRVRSCAQPVLSICIAGVQARGDPADPAGRRRHGPRRIRLDRGNQRPTCDPTMGFAAADRAANYFIQQPFYNWTRQSARTMGSVISFHYGRRSTSPQQAGELVAAQSETRQSRHVKSPIPGGRDEVRVLVNSDTAATPRRVRDLREKLMLPAPGTSEARAAHQIIEMPAQYAGRRRRLPRSTSADGRRLRTLTIAARPKKTGTSPPAEQPSSAPHGWGSNCLRLLDHPASANSVSSWNGRPMSAGQAARPFASTRSAPICPGSPPVHVT